MKTLQEILARQAAIKTRLGEIEAVAAPADDADEATRSAFAALPTETDDLLAEWDVLEADRVPLAARAAKLDAIRSASVAPANTEGGFGAPQVMRKVEDPYAGLDAVRSGRLDVGVMRSRALAGIERGDAQGVSDEARQNATALVDGLSRNPAVLRMALLTGSPAYRSAFEKILERPQDFHAFLTPEEADAYRMAADIHRTALSDTAANGGYAIPFLLDPSIILTNAGSANPMRQIATIKQGTSNKWNGVTSAGVTAEWKAEGSQAADASPTIAQPSITAYLADAYVFGSYEVFQDTNLAAELPMLIADAKDRLEADANVVGSGSGAPFGAITSVTAVTSSRVSPTTGGVFTSSSSADVFKVEAQVPARWRAKASWISNISTYDIIRQMSPLAQGSTFLVSMMDGLPDKLKGHRMYEATSVVSTVTTGSNILLCGDFSQYYLYDRVGMNVEYVPNVFGANGRPTGQRGWIAWWRNGGDVVAPDAFRVLKL